MVHALLRSLTVLYLGDAQGGCLLLVHLGQDRTPGNVKTTGETYPAR